MRKIVRTEMPVADFGEPARLVDRPVGPARLVIETFSKARAEPPVIPLRVTSVRTTGWVEPHSGAAIYVAHEELQRKDAMLWDATTFCDARGRIFALAEAMPTTEQLGIRHDGETDNAPALAKMAKWMAFSGQLSIRWANGIANSSEPWRVPRGARIIGQGPNAGLRNTAPRSEIGNRRTPLLLGNWHPFHAGYKRPGIYFAKGTDRLTSNQWVRGGISGANARIHEVREERGSPANGDNSGFLWLVALSGSFVDDEPLLVEGKRVAKADFSRGYANFFDNKLRFETGWYHRYGKRCRALSGVSRSDQSARFDPAEAALFKVGDVYPIYTDEHVVNNSNNSAMLMPIDQSLVRVISINEEEGELLFESKIGFDSDSPPWLMHLTGEELDINEQPIFILQDVHIENMVFEGYIVLGSVGGAVYNCNLRNIRGLGELGISFNALTRSTIDGVDYKCDRAPALEIKFGHHDGVVRNIKVKGPKTSPNSMGIFSVGEECRDLLVDNFAVEAPSLSALAFQMQPGRNCVFRNGVVNIPNSDRPPVLFYASDARSIVGSGLNNVTIRHKAAQHIVFQGGVKGRPYEAQECFIIGCRFESTTNTATQLAGYFAGGQRNRITNNWFSGGRFSFAGAESKGNVVENNVTDTPVVEGKYLRQNRSSGNRAH